MKTVVIAGASGLIGSELLKLLLQDKSIEEVIALVRSPLRISNMKLQQIVVDFNLIENYQADISGHAIYCCLGSTIKKTPDLNDYRKVDHDYPVKLAEIASRNKMAQYHVVSALGASPDSKIFYNRLKGEVENDVKAFQFKSIHIYQPALLTGNRLEHRRFEKLFVNAMKLINPLLIGKLNQFRSIKATTVAQAMINQTIKNLEGVHTYPSDVIKRLA